jgi:isopentenyl phosphate kinase
MIFLKLGGSLITDKNTPYTHRPETLKRLAKEIANTRQANPEMQLIIGHGSGSFGHVPAKKYQTRQGVQTGAEWHGFSTVWYAAHQLNNFVMQSLHEAGLPAIAFPPSASITAQNGEVLSWDIKPIRSALHAGLIPVIFGDVIFDLQLGGTILSTEELFSPLTQRMEVTRILLAGIDEGVFADYPTCENLISSITSENYPGIKNQISGSAATDVTGGMSKKVELMVALVKEFPQLSISIFSGNEPENTERSLCGEKIGTQISAQ